MPKAHDSVHRYQLVNIGKNKEYKVYHCNLLNCPHYKRTEEMFNVLSLCNRCGLPFMWNHSKNRGQVKPHCEEYTKSRKPNEPTKTVDKNAINSLVQNILANAGKT